MRLKEFYLMEGEGHASTIEYWQVGFLQSFSSSTPLKRQYIADKTFVSWLYCIYDRISAYNIIRTTYSTGERGGGQEGDDDAC